MNLLFLSGLYPPEARGGGELSTHLIARALVRRGHTVTVLTSGGEGETVIDGVTVRRVAVELTAKPLFERWHSTRVGRQVVAEVGDPGMYDVVHAHDFRSALALATLKWPQVMATVRDYAPVCGTTHNILADGMRCHCRWGEVWRTQRVQEAAWWRKAPRAWQYAFNVGWRREAFSRLPTLVFISMAQRREVAEQLTLPRSTSIVYNPVSDEYLREAPGRAVAGRVLYVGRVEDYKGVELLLGGWRELVKRFDHAQLVIVGEGAQRAEYERLVATEGLQYSVSFVGRVVWERMRAVYDQAQVVVAPHRWTEPFGRTVAEAMARGRIVVAADSGGPSEMIENGQSGFLFEAGLEVALVEAMGKALSLSDGARREMGAMARGWVGEHLSEERIAREYEEVYEVASSK